MIATLRLTTMALAFAALTASGAANAGLPPYQLSGDTTSGGILDWGDRYSIFNFSVTTTGTYEFSASANYNNVILLFAYPYSGVFGSNWIQGANADSGGSGQENFSAALTAGATYALMNTGDGSNQFGAFTTEISGPGAIIPLAAVPEPESYALLLAGLGFLGAINRKGGGRRLRRISAS